MSWMLSCIGCGGKKLVDKEEAKVLDFQHYSLTSVPPYVFECERFLEELYLDFNQICELPRELFLCNELLILSLSDNDLHVLPPAISSLSNLTTLDLSKNGISDIPDSIKSCKKLRSVNASTNPLCRLPEGFTQLVALKELSLSDTFLEYLPANFGRLTGLEILELRENQLNTLPRSFTRLTALKKLDLGQNEFTELPEVVGHLTSLTDLWIDSNRIKLIPVEIGKLTHLSFVDASKNRISEIDENIGNCRSLTHLYLTRNELEELPDSICLCTKLTVLHVDDNHMDHLPEELGRLDRIVELKVSQNEISFLPFSMGLLRSLQFLHVDDNLLGTLPGELGSCISLIVITAAHNNITELPAEMGSLGWLRVLNLCGNSLENLPVSFTKLQLTALWLSENQAKPLVPLNCTNEGGQKVLTCFMLPQSMTQSPPIGDQVEDRPPTEAEIEARRARSMIHFADGDMKPSGRLTRVPTPYPKELRALAKHTKNILALKKEKEKGSVAVVAKEKSAVAREAKKVNSSEESSKMVMIKNEEAVKVASNKIIESAIAPPVEIKSVPTEKVTTISPATTEVKTTTTSLVENLMCQNGGPPPRVPSESSVVPSSESPQITKRIQSREGENEAVTVRENERPNVQINQIKVPMSLPDKVVPVSHTSYTSQPRIPAEDVKHNFNIDKSIREASFMSPLPQIQSLRPASIAVADISATSERIKHTYPARPGSLALDNALGPWHNKRPGSLAAPINTVGIPMASPTQRSSSQNMLYEDQRSPSFFTDSWGTSHSPSHSPVKTDLHPRVVEESQEEFYKEQQSNGETEDMGHRDTGHRDMGHRDTGHRDMGHRDMGHSDMGHSLKEVRPTDDSKANASYFSKPITLHEENLVGTYHDKDKQIEGSLHSTVLPNSELSSPNAGLVSTISRVTEEGSDEDGGSSYQDRERVVSKIPKIPLFSPSKPQQLPEVAPEIPAPSKVTLTPSGISSKIPHFFAPTKIAQVTSPKVASPPEGGITKDFVSSPSGIPAPNFAYTSPYSKIPEKPRTSIPTTTPIGRELDIENKYPGEERTTTTRRIPLKLEQPTKVKRELTPPSKEIISPKGSSRIPTFGSPLSPEIKSPIIVSQSPSQIETRNPTSPGFIPSPSQIETRNPTSPGIIPSPSQIETRNPTSPGFIPSPSQIETKIPIAPFARSPSQTDNDSSIPIKRGNSIPKPKQILSPVEKPINQTGIPILSPNDSSTERSSRIPSSTSNSSLRGRKSGIPKSGVPVLAEKNMKPAGGRRLANPSS